MEFETSAVLDRTAELSPQSRQRQKNKHNNMHEITSINKLVIAYIVGLTLQLAPCGQKIPDLNLINI